MFKVFSAESIQGTVLQYSIFDRWGGLLYHQENFPLQSEEYWWDGTVDGNKLEEGVYVYIIKVQLDGIEEIKLEEGSVMLIR